jgi:hypothetical protein
MLYDTLTEMEVGDNEGKQKLELYCDDGEMLYDNANEELWANTNRKNYITP